MTTIAYRDGIMAADSGATTSSEAGGTRKSRCRKLYRKFVVLHDPLRQSVEVQDILIGIAGEGFAGLLFIDALYSQKPDEADAIKERLIVGEADFSAIVLTRNGLFEYDRWSRYEAIIDPFYSVGSGAKAALGAMHMGATARQAVLIAHQVDPYTFGKVVSAKLLPHDTDYLGTMKDAVAEGLHEIETDETAEGASIRAV